jgi:putative NADH-flavin reductase
MNVSILGATGGTGQELTKQALALGHTVKVLVRSPEKVTTRHDRLEVVKMDLLNESVATLAVKLGGSEVVLSALGLRDLGITQFYSESAKQLVAAAQQAQVKRLMIVSSVGTDPTDHEPWWYLWLVRRLLINFYVDMARMEQFVMDTATLDWIIVRPSYLTNGEQTGVYRVTPRHCPRGGIRISRADLADFMLKQLEQDTYVGQTPALAY